EAPTGRVKIGSLLSGNFCRLRTRRFQISTMHEVISEMTQLTTEITDSRYFEPQDHRNHTQFIFIRSQGTERSFSSQSQNDPSTGLRGISARPVASPLGKI
ncbi:hypothetical protein KC19_12G120400, partial [Ceratodon purpureus]